MKKAFVPFSSIGDTISKWTPLRAILGPVHGGVVGRVGCGEVVEHVVVGSLRDATLVLFAVIVVEGILKVQEDMRIKNSLISSSFIAQLLLQLTSLTILVRDQLFQVKLRISFHFQNNLVLTSKDKEFNRTDTSPFRIMVSVS